MLSTLIIIPVFISTMLLLGLVIDTTSINSKQIEPLYYIFSFLITFSILGKIVSPYTKNISKRCLVVLRILLIIINIAIPFIIVYNLSEHPPRRKPVVAFKSEVSGKLPEFILMCDERDITLPNNTDLTSFINIESQSCGYQGKITFTVIAKWNKGDCTATITETGVSFFGKDCR